MRPYLIRLTCVSLFAASPVLHAQSLTFAPSTQATVAGARGALAVDINRDGWMDIATANTGRNTVGLVINRGAAGGFLPTREIAVGAGPFDIAAGDIDRDGVEDLVVACPDAPTIEVLFLRPDGAVKSRRVISTAESRGVAVADVDRDGKLDVVYSDYARNRVGLIAGNGAGGFLPLRYWGVSIKPQGILVSDFDHDRFMDIMLANATGSLLTVLYGTHTTSVITRGYAAGRTHNVLSAVDMDRDGWLDIAAVSSNTNAVSFFRGSASGFALAGTRTTGASPRGLASGDFNHDGRADFAVGNFSSNTVTVLLGRRDGSVVADRFGDLPAGAGARSTMAADFDHDGRTDIAAMAQSSSSFTLFANVTAFVRAGFAFSQRDLPLHPTTIGFGGVADFNENGILDIVTFNEILLDGVTSVRPLTPSRTSVTTVAVGDLNVDGHLDLAYGINVGDVSQSGVDVYFGDGHGGFAYRLAFFDLPSVRDIEIADVDRDGRPDIVASGLRQFWVIRNTRAGEQLDTYSLPSVFTEGMRLSDVNRDGDLDLVATFANPNLITVWRNDGSGRFSAPNNAEIPIAGSEFQLADLNEDGRQDIVMGDRDVAVLLATGDGTWGAPVHYPPVNPPNLGFTRTMVGDFTEDGHVDVFTISGGLLAGRGDGTLSAPEDFGVEVLGIAVDWNRDGLVDIVSPRVVLLNERRATNRPPTADAGGDYSFGYQEQFGVEPNFLRSESVDPDLHRLRYEWRDADGTLFGEDFYAFFPARPPGTYTATLTVRDGRGGEDTDTFRVTITPFLEMVMHADQRMNDVGWQFVDDASAASQMRAFFPNADAPKVTTAIPDPSSFVDFWITPDPTQTYKLWVRLKAENNRGRNDSIWVQFTGAVDPAGRPNYRIGTTEGLEVNLEECLGCGVSGWGWEDDGWGAVNRNGVLLRFPGGGPQRLRVQVREDGVSFDQIVLSAIRFRTSRPGTAKNDTLILERTQPGVP